MIQMQDPLLPCLDNESYEKCLALLQNIVPDEPLDGDVEVEAYFVDPCREVLLVYLHTAKSGQLVEVLSGWDHWLILVGPAKRREPATPAPLAVATLPAICALGDHSFEKNPPQFYLLPASPVSCEHGSSEVQVALSDMLGTWVGPVLLQSC